MSISIITPHFNDYAGIKRIHSCLLKQDSDQWEWIIVDDFSDIKINESLKGYFKKHESSKIKLIFNDKKSNGSVCRNIGAGHSSFNLLVFLDSDDIILKDFVRNRLIQVNEFTIFRNYNISDKKGNNKPVKKISSNFLNHFLKAQFVWQTTAILWDKSFFIKIGKFNPDLKRLQDVELSIRALFLGTKYKDIDNKIDFFYCVSPIDIKKRPVKLICESVNYLITNIHVNYKLTMHQQSLIKGYYFVCVRYLNKSKQKNDIIYVRECLKTFYIKNYISLYKYSIGLMFLIFFKFNIISDELFLKLNRYFYK